MDDTTGEMSAGTTGETETGDETEDGESSGSIEEWGGAAMLLRTLSNEGGYCEDVCGGSQCIEAIDVVEGNGNVRSCGQYTVGECSCGDVTPAIDSSSTHAVSECFLNPNSGSRLAVDPPLWDAGSCDDFCGSFGFACAGTVWAPQKSCPDLEADDWAIYLDGPTVRPDDIEGPDGVFRVMCVI